MSVPPTLPRPELSSLEVGDYWAKTNALGEPRTSVCQHGLHVAGAARFLLRARPLAIPTQLSNSVILTAGLHDIGKVSPAFLCKCPKWLQLHGLASLALRAGWGERYERDHARASQKYLQNGSSAPQKDEEFHAWALIAGAHHGRLQGRWIRNCAIGKGEWENARDAVAARIADDLGISRSSLDLPLDDDTLLVIAGLISTADWLGSDEQWFHPDHLPAPDAVDEVAARAVKEAGFFAPCVKQRALPAILPRLPSPNDLQKACFEMAAGPSLMIIEAPMGMGKTEAALAAAYRLWFEGAAQGLYFALPTRLTSDRIHKRVAEFLSDVDLRTAATRLIHGLAWLHDSLPATQNRLPIHQDETEASSLLARDWFRSSRRALLDNFGVGTIDQALLGVVPAKHLSIRRFALAGKVVVLDEVHSYDFHTGTLIVELVRSLLASSASVIVLSATLTDRQRREILDGAGVSPDDARDDRGAYPRVTCVERQTRVVSVRTPPPPPSRVVALRHLHADDPVWIENVIAAAEQGACVLIFRNTIGLAQATYRTLKSAVREHGPEVALLHSRFPAWRRQELEDNWMERLGRDGSRRPRGAIVVATQVAEQSVDLDADLIVTDLSPTDFLLQRIGRLWRHSRASRPQPFPACWVLHPVLPEVNADPAAWKAALGASGHVYDPWTLLRASSLWSRSETVTIPTDIRTWIEKSLTADPSDPPAWEHLRAESIRKSEALKQRAQQLTHLLAQPMTRDDENEQMLTRVGGLPTRPVLIVNGSATLSARPWHLLDGSTLDLCLRGFDLPRARAIHRNLIQVPSWMLPGPDSDLPGLGDLARGAVVLQLGEDGALKPREGVLRRELSYRSDLGLVAQPAPAPGRDWNSSGLDNTFYDGTADEFDE